MGGGEGGFRYPVDTLGLAMYQSGTSRTLDHAQYKSSGMSACEQLHTHFTI